MANSSATGGYLLPTSTIVDDDALENLLQQVVVGITGLDINLVRPRWQPEPPNEPEPAVDWVAFGVVSSDPEPGILTPYGDIEADGLYYQVEHETFDTLASFYGPHASQYSRMLRQGLYIDQNRDALVAVGINIVAVERPTRAPELFKNRYRNRVDRVARFRREIRSTYPILHLLAADGNVRTDGGLVTPWLTPSLPS
jgi:hypothetical protein